jgi:hypothetical protein
MGQSLVKAMEMALQAGPPEAAELVACECVVEAETKDHLNWELIELASKALEGDEARALKDAYEQVEEQEDEHLYHTTGWCRELWIASLGLPAVLPPPEEEKEFKTAIGAARAKQARKDMLLPTSRRLAVPSAIPVRLGSGPLGLLLAGPHGPRLLLVLLTFRMEAGQPAR